MTIITLTGAVVAEAVDEVLEAASAASSAKAAKVAVDNAWKGVEQDTLSTFIDYGIKTAIVAEEDGTFTRVTAEGLDEISRSIDVEAALSLLNDEQITAIATMTISLAAVDAAITTGLIPAALAEQFIKIKQTKPSLRVTFNAKNVEA